VVTTRRCAAAGPRAPLYRVEPTPSRRARNRFAKRGTVLAASLGASHQAAASHSALVGMVARQEQQEHTEQQMGIEVGLFGLIILILNVWAIVRTLGSSAGIVSKVLWVVIILILPVLGFILWLLLGPKR
jgi:hypothetical protein